MNLLIQLFTHKRKIAAIIFFTFITITSYSQESGSIKGRLLEKNSPVEFADVSLSVVKDTTKVLYYTSTDSTGMFILKKIPFGQYKLTAKILGYKTISKLLTITKVKSIVDLGNMSMEPDAVMLNSLTVTAQQKIIQKTPEGFVVNAAANLTQVGGTATDLLRNTPTVNVDEEGAVTLRGQTPLILIDGRNSAFTNTDQIAASSVESIEIITNPSAKYDASAESGIINIKLKKNKLSGTSGGITVGAGFGSKWRANSSVFLSHKTEKWNWGIAYDNRFAKRTRIINGDRTNFNLQDEHQLIQIRHDKNFDKLQNLKFNADYTPDKKNIFSFEAIGNKSGHDNDESLTSAWYTQDNKLNSKWNRHSTEIERPLAGESTLGYSHKFDDERKSLSASITVSYDEFKQNTDIPSQTLDENDNPVGDPYYGLTHDYEHTTVTTALFDYTFPILSKVTLSTGYKGKFRKLHTDFLTAEKIGEVYVPTTSASDIFKFNEQVHAAYVLFNGFTGSKDNPRWRYIAGIRAEQVFNDGASQTAATSFKNNYINFFPTLNIAYYLNADEFWKLSYAKRINYPRSDELNPFLDVTDSLNQHGGNPDLKPEIAHSFEFGYNKDWKTYSLTSTLFYRYIANDIQQYSQLLPSGITISRETNMGSAIRYGWENIFYMHPVPFYDATFSLSLFQRSVNGNVAGNAISNSGFSANGKLINNFSWGQSKFQLFLNYNSPRVSAQSRSIAVYYADLGFQQKFGKNARLGISLTDVFNTMKYGGNSKTADYISIRISKADTRAILFTFAYTFNTELKETLQESSSED